MTEIRTTIQVQFGSDKDAYITAEIDGRPDGLNQGKTSFAPGDTAYFLIFKSQGVDVQQILSSAGSISRRSRSLYVTRTEDVFFNDTNEGSLGVPSTGIDSIVWLGNSLGLVTLQSDQMTLKSTQKGIAIARITYSTSPESYGIQSPKSVGNGIINFSISVLIKATAP